MECSFFSKKKLYTKVTIPGIWGLSKKTMNWSKKLNELKVLLYVCCPRLPYLFMKYCFFTFSFLVSILAIGQTSNYKTLSFCTDVGPVELEFAGDSIRGRYRIMVVKDPFDGIIKGTFKEGLIEGVWIDPDGSGKIIFAFTSDLNEFTAVFNNHKKPNHWFVTPWRAASTTFYPLAPEEKKRDLICAWK